jgi:hypothetical protein
MDHKISDMPTRSTPADGLLVGHHWDFALGLLRSVGME